MLYARRPDECYLPPLYLCFKQFCFKQLTVITRMLRARRPDECYLAPPKYVPWVQAELEREVAAKAEADQVR